MPKLLKCTKKKPGNGAFVLDDGDHAAPQFFAEPPGKRPHFKLLSRGRYGTRPDVLVFDEARFRLEPCERPSANLRNLRLRLQSIFLLALSLQSLSRQQWLRHWQGWMAGRRRTWVMNVDFDPSNARPLYPDCDQTADIERGRRRAIKRHCVADSPCP
jgi:hypothetical protein